ncbi:hypothetical protein F4778DRAFT_69250 [Xylariomycetidae sp. FL2044]|nr:hypothetical protein F4778DRAFT_69250 [Xylariomycetidae sp. FL2044]
MDESTISKSPTPHVNRPIRCTPGPDGSRVPRRRRSRSGLTTAPMLGSGLSGLLGRYKAGASSLSRDQVTDSQSLLFDEPAIIGPVVASDTTPAPSDILETLTSTPIQSGISSPNSTPPIWESQLPKSREIQNLAYTPGRVHESPSAKLSEFSQTTCADPRQFPDDTATYGAAARAIPDDYRNRLSQPASFGLPVWESQQMKQRLDFDRKVQRTGQTTSNTLLPPVHVFIDYSNYYCGFFDSWKVAQGFHPSSRLTAPHHNFSRLVQILERSRTIEKRVLVGSVASHTKNTPDHWPAHFKEAAAYGFRMMIHTRVPKLTTTPSKRRRGNQNPFKLNEVSTASSDESTGLVFQPLAQIKNGEQGVDECLQLHITTSLLERQAPATMVLVTGDAAEAEFSDGFKVYAEFVLERNWNLELFTWKRSVSSAWKNYNFMQQYSNQFRIIYLDDFLEELSDEQPW